ncbi:terpene synthase family protein [Streptomyces sp. JH34]|uniref:terpene synthase family protein n=1 Tax=Streptomyces sp. JH34 TaxID=2793633 RepID=UPI0023F6F0E9|nr:terpene synthase family protein [Streptomyces sp. JH34]MDF6016931.1 terpene synthase family protein [Streptomyces sp. JH34]
MGEHPPGPAVPTGQDGSSREPSNGQPEATAARTVEIRLTYPRDWQCATPASADFDANPQTESWLRSLGIFSSREENGRYVQWADPGRWARDAFPLAPPERNLIISKIFAMATTHDDRLENVGIHEEVIESYGQAIMAESDRPTTFDDPYSVGWWEIGQELLRGEISFTWRRRFAQHITVWYRGFNDEIALLHRSGRHPTEDDYMTLRHKNSGMVWWIDLAELSLGRTLPGPVVGSNPLFRRLCHLDREIELLYNDLYSAEKDSRDRLPNLISIISRQNGCSMAEAARLIAHRHATVLREIQDVESDLRAGTPEIGWWLDAFRHYVPGTDLPHADVGRFGQLQHLEDGGEIRVIPQWAD